jgi:hypothetical protein
MNTISKMVGVGGEVSKGLVVSKRPQTKEPHQGRNQGSIVSEFRSQALAHACNPSYSRGGDQENGGLRPARQKFLETPISTRGWAQWHVPVIPTT